MSHLDPPFSSGTRRDTLIVALCSRAWFCPCCASARLPLFRHTRAGADQALEIFSATEAGGCRARRGYDIVISQRGASMHSKCEDVCMCVSVRARVCSRTCQCPILSAWIACQLSTEVWRHSHGTFADIHHEHCVGQNPVVARPQLGSQWVQRPPQRTAQSAGERKQMPTTGVPLRVDQAAFLKAVVASVNTPLVRRAGLGLRVEKCRWTLAAWRGGPAQSTEAGATKPLAGMQGVASSFCMTSLRAFIQTEGPRQGVPARNPERMEHILLTTPIAVGYWPHPALASSTAFDRISDGTSCAGTRHCT